METRIAQHFTGAGSRWTVLHKPVQVLSCLPGDRVLENVTTVALMCEHGWQRVRGGPWCQIELPACPAPITKAMQYNSSAAPAEAQSSAPNEEEALAD